MSLSYNEERKREAKERARMLGCKGKKYRASILGEL